MSKKLSPTPPANFDVTDDSSEARSQLPEDFRQKSISGAISFTLRSLFLYGIGIVTAAILGAYLTAVEFGIYGLVTQVVGLLQFFSSVGLGPALIQKDEEPDAKDYQAVFTVQQLLSWLIVLAAVLLVMAGIWQEKLGTAGQWVLLALAFSFPLDTLRIIPAIILERKLDFSKLVIPNIFEQLVYNAVLLYLVVIAKQGVLAYAYAVILRGIVGAAVMTMIQPWPFGINLDFQRVRNFLGTGVKFQAADILARIKDQLFYLLLGTWLPLQQFGYITWAKSWSQMPYLLTVQNVIAITFPTYSRLQKHPELLKRAIEKTLYFVTLSIFPLLCGMVLFIRPLVTLIPRYNQWQPAVLTFILFVLSIGWAAISTPLTNTLSATGRVGTTLKLMMMWTSLTWLITPLLVWWIGFEGVAWAAFAIAFTSFMPIYYVKKFIQFEYWSSIKVPIMASLVMLLVGLFGQNFWSQSVLMMLVGMVITSLAYGSGIIVFGFGQLKKEVLSLRRKK